MQKEQSINDILSETENPTQTERSKLYLAMVLDESGSMCCGYQETINGFNEQLQTIKATQEDNVDVEVILTTFNFGAKVVKDFVALEDVAELTENEYSPNGGTAMYDGVGLTISKLLERDDITDDNTQVLMVVLSDGAENMSQKYTQSTVAEMIQTVKETNRWTITYMGANQDLSKIAKGLNIDAGNTVIFDASDAGGYAAGANMRSAATANFMGSLGAKGPNGDAGVQGDIQASTTFYSSVE